MPERTEQLIQFPNVGLFLMGPKRTVPPTALRRALGVHESNIGSIKSRRNDTLLYALPNAHSLGRLSTDRFQAVGTIIYRNNISLLTGNDGERITFLKSPPAIGQADSLFLTGGGQSRKINSTGTVQNWGITAPADGLVVTAGANSTKQIEAFEDNTTWTYSGVTANANEATIRQQGTNSLHLTIAADTLATLQKAAVLDLTTYGGGVSSPNEDHIEFWIRISNSPAFDYILLRFDVGAGNFATDYYQFKVNSTQDTPRNDAFGIGVSPLVNEQEMEFLSGGSSGDEGEEGDAPAGEAGGVDADAAGSPGSSGDTGIADEGDAVTGPDTWTRIRIPKKSFFRSGAGAGTWANVAAIQFTVKTNSYGFIELYLDDCELIGAAGLEGRYRYHYTFRNTTTGNRSNPNPTYVQISDIRRVSIAGSSLPLSTDSQVNQREIWRTLGNGTLFFRGHLISNNTDTTFTDTVADYKGLNSLTGTTYLEPTELRFDNAKPDDTYSDFLITNLTAFWLSNDTGKRGRLYHSPVGRPEGVKSFITLTSDNDILQRIVEYNGVIYIISLDGMYRLDGTDPYISRRIRGIPGVPTVNKRTVLSSPYGILYQAHDGIRLFDGSRSELIFHERIGNLFRGEALDYFPSFEGVYATFFRNQYYISNNSRTLCLNIQTGFIRELGIALNALLFEEDTQLLIGALPDEISIIENESTGPFPDFDIETGSLQLAVGQRELVKRVRFKGVFNQQSITPTLILDGISTVLPPFTLASGSVEYPIGRPAQSVSFRLQGTLTQEIEVEAVEVDIYSAGV